MTPRTAIATVAVLALAACDTAEREVVEAVPDGPTVSTGTFTALLNGEPYEAPAIYRTDDTGWFFLEAITADSTQYPPYVQRVAFGALGTGFVEGEARELIEQGGGFPAVFVFESIGDGVLQQFNPVEGVVGGLRVVEADSAAGRFRALFEGTFAAISPPRSEHQRLADTLRFTNGEFVIDLARDGE